MPKERRNAIVIMVKNPVAGRVKTRLAVDIGEGPALEVYEALLAHTAEVVRTLDVERLVFHSDHIERSGPFAQDGFRQYVQCDGDLGARLDYAASIPFKNQHRKVLIIGGDCPTLQADHLQEAWDLLEDNDLVIGPARDGGYYLLGMKAWHRWLFQDMPWSTERLLPRTKEAAAEHGMQVHLLPELNDIDTLADLQDSPLSGMAQLK